MSSYIKKALQTSIIHIERFKEFGPNRNTIIGPAKLEIPDFPHQKTVWSRPSLLLNNSGELMYCGDEICWVLKDNEWTSHSRFLKPRHNKVMVQMSNGSYVFGYTYGDSENTSEFLPNKSCKWQAGPSIPYDKRVSMYSALAVSKNEFVLIGGSTTLSDIGTILKFNISTSKWTVVGNLKHPRSECSVAVFNDKIIVCNGRDANKILKSTEIIPLKRISGEKEIEFLPIRKGGDTRLARCHGGIGVVQDGDSQKLIRFGNGVPTQEWNDETETWRISTQIKSYNMSDTGFISKGTHYFH